MARYTSIKGLQIKAEVAGAGLVKDGSGNFTINVDDSSLEISTDTLQVKSSGITNDMLAGSIADGKLASDYIQTSEVDDSSIEFNAGSLNVKASGITNDMLAGSIADGKLASDYIQTSEVDDSTIEFNGGSLNIKAAGVDTAQLANEAVEVVKLAINNSEQDGYVLTWNDGGYMEWTAKASITEDYLQESELKKEDETANCDGTTTDFTLSSSPVSNSVQVYLNGMLMAEGSGKDYTLVGTTVSFATAPEADAVLVIYYIAT